MFFNLVSTKGTTGREEQEKSEEQRKKERVADPPLVGGKINDGRALNLAREIN